MINWKNFDSLASYKEIADVERVNLAEAMTGANGAERVKKYSVPMAAGMAYNYAAKQVDENVLSALEKLAEEAQLTEKYKALYNGEVINTGEKRLVLHQLTRGQVDENVLSALEKLAEEAQLTEKYKALYNGEVINTGEKRLVLHQLTRGQLGDAVVADGVDKRAFYVEQQDKIAEFANKVHAGEITNAAGEKFTTVVQIGIGGSDLGPRAMYLALENWAKKNNTFKMEAKFISNVDPDDAAAVVQIGIGGSDLGPRAMYLALENWAKKNNTFKMEAKFISNVDPDDAAAVLNSIDVAHSIFVLVSKSGTTLETLTNESFVKDALKNAGLDASRHMIAATLETLTNESFVKDALKNAGLDASRHMIAVTSETSPLAKSDDYLAAFVMDDYIGGRFSSTSAVGGAVLSLAFGPEVFAQFLEGAAEEDKLAMNTDLGRKYLHSSWKGQQRKTSLP